MKMNAAAFLTELRRRTQVAFNGRDPLADARHFLELHPETGEGQALRKVIRTLATMRGEFSESEVWLFSAETLAIADVLVEARIEGRYSESDWHQDQA